MKNALNKTLLVMVLAATAGEAMAAGDSIDIKVIGQIVPAACAASVTGGGDCGLQLHAVQHHIPGWLHSAGG